MGCLLSKQLPRWTLYAVEDPRELSRGERKLMVNPAGMRSDSGSPDCEVHESSSSPDHLLTDICKPKAEDFVFCNLENKMCLKQPGSVNGEQFIIDTCTDCDLYVLDYCDMVTIDDCQRCRIVVGPSTSSIFLRNCSDCNVMGICQQFRARDCVNCNILLHCRTRPIIEESSKMSFGCCDLRYSKLNDHMGNSGLSVFNNFWGHIHDYTPKDGNWQFLPPDYGSDKLLTLKDEALEMINNEEIPATLLKTSGERPLDSKSQEYLFVLFPSTSLGEATKFAEYASQEATILRTNQATIPEHICHEMAKHSSWNETATEALCKGLCVGLEIMGDGCLSALSACAEEQGAVMTSANDAAELFRYLGIDG